MSFVYDQELWRFKKVDWFISNGQSTFHKHPYMKITKNIKHKQQKKPYTPNAK